MLKTALNCLVFGLAIQAHAEDKTLCTTFWKNVRTANNEYEERKDPQAGERLLRLLPTERQHVLTNCPKYSETLQALKHSDYRLKQLQARDPVAIKVESRIRKILTGLRK